MNANLVEYFESFLKKNQIPYLEIKSLNDDKVDLIIKLYFPKVIKRLCKIFDETFLLKNKDNIVIRKNRDGYYEVDFELIFDKKVINIRINSILQNTWGIV